MAKDALSGILTSLDSRKMTIPEPSEISGKEIYYIEPDVKAVFAVYAG